MMHRKRGWAVAAVLLVVLQLLLQTRAAHIVQQNPTVTVTLSSPLTAGQLAAAREWEKSNANTQAVTASFWSEKAAAVSADSDRTAEDVTCIGFDGTAQDCLPVEYLQGTAPGVVGQQCAISSTLAWTLFGSYDIMGLTVHWTVPSISFPACLKVKAKRFFIRRKAALPTRRCGVFRPTPPKRTPNSGPQQPVPERSPPSLTAPKRHGWLKQRVPCLP